MDCISRIGTVEGGDRRRHGLVMMITIALVQELTSSVSNGLQKEQRNCTRVDVIRDQGITKLETYFYTS